MIPLNTHATQKGRYFAANSFRRLTRARSLAPSIPLAAACAIALAAVSAAPPPARVHTTNQSHKNFSPNFARASTALPGAYLFRPTATAAPVGEALSTPRRGHTATPDRRRARAARGRRRGRHG